MLVMTTVAQLEWEHWTIEMKVHLIASMKQHGKSNVDKEMKCAEYCRSDWNSSLILLQSACAPWMGTVNLVTNRWMHSNGSCSSSIFSYPWVASTLMIPHTTWWSDHSIRDWRQSHPDKIPHNASCSTPLFYKTAWWKLINLFLIFVLYFFSM